MIDGIDDQDIKELINLLKTADSKELMSQLESLKRIFQTMVLLCEGIEKLIYLVGTSEKDDINAISC